MIVTCSSCSARYKFDEAKLNGRIAKITCPKCNFVFLVKPDGTSVEAPEEATVPAPKDTTERTGTAPPKATAPKGVAGRDFSELGITWRVRCGLDVFHEFHSLAELEGMLEANKVGTRDSISYDNRAWRPLETIDDLSAYFARIWNRAERGEIQVVEDEDEDDDEDVADAPTTLMDDSALAEHLKEGRGTETPPPPMGLAEAKEHGHRPVGSDLTATPPPGAPPPPGKESQADAFAKLAQRKQDEDRGLFPIILGTAFVALLLLAAAFSISKTSFLGQKPPTQDPTLEQAAQPPASEGSVDDPTHEGDDHEEE